VDKDQQNISRGSLLQKIAIAPFAIGAFAALQAQEAEAAGMTQKAAGYIKVSKIKGKNCANCALYIAAKPGKKYGACQAVSGQIAPLAYCNLYAKKAG
jgi:hypothetical protein